MGIAATCRLLGFLEWRLVAASFSHERVQASNHWMFGLLRLLLPLSKFNMGLVQLFQFLKRGTEKQLTAAPVDLEEEWSMIWKKTLSFSMKAVLFSMIRTQKTKVIPVCLSWIM